MPRQWSTMYGDIRSQLAPKVLAGHLKDAGIDVQVRRWLYDDGGLYIQVLDVDDFTLSRVRTNGYHVDAICASFQWLQTTTSLMSAALTNLEIRHRFLVFNGRPACVDYFHHGWPRRGRCSMLETLSLG